MGRGGPAAKAGAGRGRGGAVRAAPTDAPKEEGGGVVRANKQLLQQLMSNNEVEADPTPLPRDAEDFDDVDGDMALSSRLVLGTQASVPRRSVPTIMSPATSRPGTSSGSRPGTSAGRVNASVPTIVARVQADVPVQTVASYCGVPLRGVPADGEQIATGPPAQVSNIQSVVRPGSRGGTGMPSPQVLPKRNAVHSSGGIGGYAGLHSRAKAAGVASSPSTGSGAGRATPRGVDASSSTVRTGAPGPKPAVRPRCGPEIFNMLRKKEVAGQPAEASVSPDIDLLEDVHQADDLHGGLTQERGFVMPIDSDASGLDEPHVRLQEVLPERTPSKAAVPSAAPEVAPAPVPAAATRARSSDARACIQASAESPARLTRALSSDARGRALPRRVPAEESDDSDDEVPQFGQGGIPWKAKLTRHPSNPAEAEERRKAAAPAPAAAATPPAPPKPPKANGLQGLEKRKMAAGSQAAVAGDRNAAEQPAEQLFYSKRPREVEYTPATLDDYKQKYASKEYGQLGTLGPDLDDDKLLMKKAIQEKVKQFSKELHRVNKARGASVPPAPKPEQQRPDPRSNARAKALEFAKNVPKPKVEPKAAPEKRAKEPQSPSVVQGKRQEEATDLIRREKQHFEDVAKVKGIKEYLSQLST
mmetsp:Transcript_69296/g.129418  ORF Transcript_69296/g.129418 Transcript_69296/m.129418 type:complete len:645 (-) Transcript_69296:113-2047(-)